MVRKDGDKITIDPNEKEGQPKSWDDLVEKYGEVIPEEDIKYSKDDYKIKKKKHKENNAWEWMKEKNYAKIFKEIEKKIEGVIGKGKFEWVDRRVFDQVFDRKTLLAIYKLMNGGIISELSWPIARGKEAHVFRGEGPNGPIAVKIFHTSNAVFRNLMKYIEGDTRFGGLKRKHRDLVTVWVRKEYRNLMRLKKNGLAVPEVFGINENVLVMEYIGDENSPSPRLRDVKIENPKEVFDELVSFLRISWNEANLVHADFSDYNVLIQEGKVRVIDVGQAVPQNHPYAKEFLVRDVERLRDWAKKQNIEINLADLIYDILESKSD